MKHFANRLINSLFAPLQEFSIQQTDTANILQHIRERVVTVLLRLCVLFGTLSVSVGTLALWQQKDWAGIIISNLSFLGVILLAVRRQIDYRIRSTMLIFLAYIFFFLNLVKGINEFTFAVLFAFVVMTTLLLGRTGGALAFMASLLTLLFANAGVSAGMLSFSGSMATFSEPFLSILYIYTDWIFFVGIFFFTTWIYFDGFSIAWQREKEATTLLAEERDRLAVAFAREQELMEQLTQAHQREIELGRMKSQIITTVSHEFRTPLTVISNSVELLTRYADRFDLNKREAIHERITDSIYYLTELLADASMVNTAHSHSFQANIISVPFVGLGQRLKKDLLQETNDPANVVVQFDKKKGTAVSLDYDFLYRTVFIFVHNALKYSPETEPILVTIQHNGHLRITVADSGIGIAPDELQQIWELFYRGRNASDKPGLGLGLHLAKRLIQAMDGTVTAVSPGLDQGSTFTIHIPQTDK